MFETSSTWAAAPPWCHRLRPRRPGDPRPWPNLGFRHVESPLGRGARRHQGHSSGPTFGPDRRGRASLTPGCLSGSPTQSDPLRRSSGSTSSQHLPAGGQLFWLLLDNPAPASGRRCPGCGPPRTSPVHRQPHASSVRADAGQDSWLQADARLLAVEPRPSLQPEPDLRKRCETAWNQAQGPSSCIACKAPWDLDDASRERRPDRDRRESSPTPSRPCARGPGHAPARGRPGGASWSWAWASSAAAS